MEFLDSVEVRDSTKFSSVDLAKDCIKHRLFISGWSLRDDLHGIRNERSNGKIFVAYLESVPIAVATVIHGHLQIFVRKCHRNKKIGSLLIQCVRDVMKSESNQSLWAGYGIQGSEDFWRKNNIKYEW